MRSQQKEWKVGDRLLIDNKYWTLNEIGEDFIIIFDDKGNEEFIPDFQKQDIKNVSAERRWLMLNL